MLTLLKALHFFSKNGSNAIGHLIGMLLRQCLTDGFFLVKRRAEDRSKIPAHCTLQYRFSHPIFTFHIISPSLNLFSTMKFMCCVSIKILPPWKLPKTFAELAFTFSNAWSALLSKSSALDLALAAWATWPSLMADLTKASDLKSRPSALAKSWQGVFQSKKPGKELSAGINCLVESQLETKSQRIGNSTQVQGSNT